MPEHPSDLDGRVAVVTGANHGIGAAVAHHLAGRGAAVVVGFLRLVTEGEPAYVAARATDGEGVAAAIRTAGGRALAVECDLADPAAPAALLDAAERAFGPASILVANASAWAADSFAGDEVDRLGRGLSPITAASATPQLLVDARGHALLIAELARRHRARAGDWGRIVALTSDGRDGFPEEASYGAAKAALESYALTAAHELGRDGITVNIVHPPITDTGWITPAVAELAAGHGAFGTIAAPADVAAAIGLLLGPAADRITGTRVMMG